MAGTPRRSPRCPVCGGPFVRRPPQHRPSGFRALSRTEAIDIDADVPRILAALLDAPARSMM